MNAETAYLFRHAVVRDAAYGLHVPTARTALHALAFEILEGLHAERPAFALELAYHAQLAGDDARFAEAERKYLQVGGDHARFNYDYPNAMQAFERLYELAADDTQARAEVADKLADMMERLGRYEAALPYFEEVREHHDHRGYVGRALVHLAWFSAGDEAEQYAAEGEQLAEELDSNQLRISFRQLRAKQRLDAGDTDGAVEMLEDAIRLAEEEGDTVQALIGHVNCSEYEARRGNLDATVRHDDAADRLSREPGYLHLRVGVLINRASTALRKRDYNTAAGYAVDAIELCERTGSRGNLGMALVRLAGARCGQGRYAESFDTFESVRPIIAETEDKELAVSWLESFAVLLRLWGKHKMLEDELASGLKELAVRVQAPELDNLRAELAFCRAELGFGVDALDQMEQQLAGMAPGHSSQLKRVALYSAAGLHGEALEILEAWEAAAPPPEPTPEPVEFIVVYHRAEALAGLGRDNHAEATAALTLAGELNLHSHPSSLLAYAVERCRKWAESVDADGGASNIA